MLRTENIISRETNSSPQHFLGAKSIFPCLPKKKKKIISTPLPETWGVPFAGCEVAPWLHAPSDCSAWLPRPCHPVPEDRAGWHCLLPQSGRTKAAGRGGWATRDRAARRSPPAPQRIPPPPRRAGTRSWSRLSGPRQGAAATHRWCW